MPVSRTMWLRGIHIDAAKMKGNARDERDNMVKEITRKWKEGFKALKDENDRLQMERDETYKDQYKTEHELCIATAASPAPVGTTKAEWVKEAYSDFRRWEKLIIKERDGKTVEITAKWKEGFRALKVENDRLQKECEATFHKEIADIDAMTKSQISQGPPK